MSQLLLITMSQLSISYWVYGSPGIFTIHIEPTARLSELQELIWEKQKPLFSGLHCSHLTLWKVPFDVNTDDDPIENIDLVDGAGGVTKLTITSTKRVSSAIPLEDVDTHVIVAQPPPKLWCWVRGLPKDTAIELQPLPHHKVSDLKNAVKEGFKAELGDISAATLVLWKVEIDGFHTQYVPVDLEEGVGGVRRLSIPEKISTIFPGPVPEDRLSIVIDTRRRFQSIDTASLEGSVDIVKSRLNISQERRKNHPGPPSTVGNPIEFQKIQKSDVIHFACARPVRREPRLPLALIHPVFGAFIDDCKEIALEARDYTFAQRFRDQMCEFYESEDHRRNELCQLLAEFDLKVTPANIGSVQERTDGHIVAGKDHPIYIQALKNESCLGKAEPSFQGLLYFQSFIDIYKLGKDSSSYHPCFIICISGPHIVFAGAALTDRANLEIFSFVPANFHITNDEAFDSLARHLAALKRALGSLERYYEKLDEKTLQHTDIIQPPFPYPTSFDNLREKTVSSLTYKDNLVGRPLLFQGSTNEGTKLVCIKFVRRYGVDVHRWCAEKGIAPELLGFQKLPGGWYLIVMELLEEPWEQLWQLKHYESFSAPVGVREQLRDTLVEMHQNHMVHGDIRDNNIMINVKDGPALMVLDFDWAGKAGEVKYPKFVSTDSELGRPEDVKDGKLILPGHDDAMVDSIF